MQNITEMMKKVQEMQIKMQQMQEDIVKQQVEGSSGGGMVKLTMNGEGRMLRCDIDPQILTQEDKEMLEDLIVAAFNNANEQLKTLREQQSSDLMGGLELPPGMKLPF